MYISTVQTEASAQFCEVSYWNYYTQDIAQLQLVD